MNYFDRDINKEDLRTAIIATDLVILTILILFFNIVQKEQKDYVDKFYENTIEVRDFTLVIDKLPQSFSQYKDTLSLK